MIEWDPPQERFRSIHRRRVELGRWGFVGYQVSLPFMGGVFEKKEAAIEADLDRIRPLVDERTVLVTHGSAEFLDAYAPRESVSPLDVDHHTNIR